MSLICDGGSQHVLIENIYNKENSNSVSKTSRHPCRSSSKAAVMISGELCVHVTRRKSQMNVMKRIHTFCPSVR